MLALGLLAVALLNAACYPLISTGLAFAPLFAFAALRALAAGLALGLVAALLRRPIPAQPRTWTILALMGFSTTSLGYLGMFHAAEFVSPGLATVIANTQPLIAALLAQTFLDERLRPLQYLGLLLGFAGVVAIGSEQLLAGGGTSFAVGLVYITIASGGLACGNVLMKSVSNQIDPLVAMAAQLLFGAVPLGAAMMLGTQPLRITWTQSFVASLLGLALPGTALASWLWFVCLKRSSLGRANAFTFLTPFAGLFLGMAFFRERPGVTAFVGLFLTVVGVALVERLSTASRASQAPSSGN